MKIFLTFVVLLILFLVWQFMRTQHFIRIGEKLAAQAVAFEQHPTNPAMSVLALGDSSAVGVGSVEPALSVAGRFGADNPSADITNIAISGAKTGEMLSQLEKVKGQQFDLIILHTGGNDIVRFTDFDEVEKDIQELLDELKPMTKKIVLLHGGNVETSLLFPAGTRWMFGKRTVDLRKRYIEIAAKDDSVVYADIYRSLKEDLFKSDPEKYYSADFFHPSEYGYGVWYEGVKKALQ